MNTLILTDNPTLLSVAQELQVRHGSIDIFQSPKGFLLDVPRLDVQKDLDRIVGHYSLVLSVHCKQFFPAELVRRVRCINVHPGLNPFNRGWYPQVFSILNGKKAGATIHEIDEQLDHGPIIVQQEYEIKSWDTSESAHNNIMKIESELLLAHFVAIRDQTYTPVPPLAEGNLNYKKDFNALTRLDLNEAVTMGEAINRLRALTHPPYQNAHFFDANGKKVYVSIALEPDPISTKSVDIE